MDTARRVAVLAGAPVLAVAAVVFVSPWDAGWDVLWLVAAGAVLEALPVPLRPGVKTSLSNVAVVLAILLHGTGGAIAVALGMTLAVFSALPRNVRWIKGPYNLAIFVFTALAASGTYALVAGIPTGPARGLTVGTWLAAVPAAFVAFSLANVVLLALAIWVTGGPSPRVTLLEMAGAGWWSVVLSAGLAIVAYVVHVEAGIFGLVLLLVPLSSARSAMAGVEAQRESLDRAVRALVRLVEAKDEYTRGHAERVADLSDRVAARVGLSADERYWIRIGAVLHDVGKVCVPLEVLNKPGGFSDDEYWQMRRHPDLGADLLERVDALAPAVPLVRQHHERIDGCGYPRGLSGDQVPLATRIVSAVDSWDAMTTTRPYRVGLPVEVAVSELRTHSGTQFDADVVEHLIAEVAPEYVLPAPQVARRTSPALAPAAT